MGERVNPFQYNLRSRAVLDRDVRHYVQAVHEAFSGEHDRVRVGAVLVKKKLVLAAYNRARNPVHNVEYGAATLHAERAVLAGALDHQRAGATLYVARLSMDDSPAPSFPCPACFEAVVSMRLKHVVYFDGHSLVKVRV
jgi:deoxycytidylate deaminase